MRNKVKLYKMPEVCQVLLLERSIFGRREKAKKRQEVSKCHELPQKL